MKARTTLRRALERTVLSKAGSRGPVGRRGAYHTPAGAPGRLPPTATGRFPAMCGIAGLLLRQAGPDADTLRSDITRMAETLRHRGPDSGGAWADAAAGVALGHRRLSIQDLSEAGHQPMASACERFVISYNGEVYNFPELRRELEKEGLGFRGHSDTEVLLAGIASWGLEETLRRTTGMFAFALWDRRDRRLRLARDRAGQKPLYYGRCGDAWLFGSELKTLRAHRDFEASIDRGALEKG